MEVNPLLTAAVGALTGGGAIGVISRWQRDQKEASDIAVGTQAKILAMAESIMDRYKEDLDRAQAKWLRDREAYEQRVGNHEARIRYLEELLRSEGIEYNGPRS